MQYAYRLQYNIPRGPIEKFEDLTEYELEYELILRHEHSQFIKDLYSNDDIDISKGSFERDMRTDPRLYAEMKRKIEAGETVDIQLPDDSNVPRYSTMHTTRVSDYVTGDVESLNPADVFGRVFGG